MLIQKANAEKVEFSSVFTGESSTTGPKLPDGKEIAIPKFEKDKWFVPHARLSKDGLPKFDARGHLARELASVENGQFKRNIANRLWALVMGRGLVYPLDMHHSSNPPSHPELLNRLTDEIGEMKFDVKDYLRALMLSQAYQRSSLLPAEAASTPPEMYTVAILKQLSAEQLFSAVVQATGQTAILKKKIDDELKAASEKDFEEMQSKPELLAKSREEKRIALCNQFVSSFGNPAGEAEDDFNPTLSGALFLINSELLSEWLLPQEGNLIDRLMKIEDSAAVAQELYLSVLTRLPEEEERAEVVEHLKKTQSVERRHWASWLGDCWLPPNFGSTINCLLDILPQHGDIDGDRFSANRIVNHEVLVRVRIARASGFPETSPGGFGWGSGGSYGAGGDLSPCCWRSDRCQPEAGLDDLARWGDESI